MRENISFFGGGQRIDVGESNAFFVLILLIADFFWIRGATTGFTGGKFWTGVDTSNIATVAGFVFDGLGGGRL